MPMRNSRKDKGMAIVAEELPEDVLIDILSRLPAKSLVRFKSVSKYWYSLILNPKFISLHHTRAQPSYCVSIVRFPENGQNYPCKRCFMHLLPNQESIDELDISFTGLHCRGPDQYRGGCDGLMCLAEYSESSICSGIVICNPATREFRRLPQPPYHSWCPRYVGFAFDSKTSDYKVVRVATLGREDLNIQIYSMIADSWKEIATMVPFRNFTPYKHPCLSLDGIFYWLSCDYSTGVHAIDALNTVEESFGRRALPAGVRFNRRFNRHITLCLLNDSIAIAVPKYNNLHNLRGHPRFTSFDIWLMDGFGVEEIWTKMYTIGPLLGIHFSFRFWENREVVLTWCENGRIVKYDQCTDSKEEYQQLCNLPKPTSIEIDCVFPYTESLVPVKR